jgi:hypothetical protein
VWWNPEDVEWDEDDAPELEDSGWCDACGCPIGVGACGGCIAVASMFPIELPPYEG